MRSIHFHMANGAGRVVEYSCRGRSLLCCVDASTSTTWETPSMHSSMMAATGPRHRSLVPQHASLIPQAITADSHVHMIPWRTRRQHRHSLYTSCCSTHPRHCSTLTRCLPWSLLDPEHRRCVQTVPPGSTMADTSWQLR